ncbi:MAG: cytochrome family protein, partial [Deltaproteobacteria bacterium]|nr:cytochrome family protein [Deltaproteobacteria bacterium]
MIQPTTWIAIALTVVVGACDLGRYNPGDSGFTDTNERSTACSSVCHGSGGEAAPPQDTLGHMETQAIGVGAHRAHVSSSGWHKRVECGTCHKVPNEIGDPGHLDTGLPAELIFAALGEGSVWNRDDQTCTNSYCHGATLTNSLAGTTTSAGGTDIAPIWTKVDGSQTQCSSCHGFPPPAPHPQNTDCGSCHPTMNPGVNTMITYPELHIDGRIDVVNAAPCDSCHGSGGQAAPPKDVGGHVITTATGVGAHAEHMISNSTWHAPIKCLECHKVPAGVNDQGHVDTPLPAEIVFGPLGGIGTWNGTKCSNTYCHGGGTSPLTGGAQISPTWTQVDGTQRQCDSCHGAPPPPPHPINSNCGACHPTMTSGFGLQITYPALHIDGKVDLENGPKCDSCHGSGGVDAPPVDTTGGTSTDLRGVGAHRTHLTTSTWRKDITCDQCHKVPTAVTEIGHVDTPLPAELTFGALAGSPTWNGATCTNTYCHGATLTGGISTNPSWTVVTGAQSQCGSCHGTPPPSPHPVDSDCGKCHDTMIAGGGLEIADPSRHIDGNLNVNTDQPCNTCHGSATSDAPPKDTLGNTSTGTRGVGAHQSHLATTTNRFLPVLCIDCHKVPGAVISIGHIDTGLPAELTFSPRAGTTAQWNGSQCTNSYCHGATLTSGTIGAGGTATAPLWTVVDGSQRKCTSCHGNPPPLPHPQVGDCGVCHNTMAPGAPTAFIAPLRHVDGNLDVNTDQPCDACHGSATNEAPPKDTLGNSATTVRGVGAHQAHVATGSIWHKDTTCTQCHTVPTTVGAVGHIDTALPAELTFTGLAAGTAWSGTTCTSYCHGTTLGAGGGATVPQWTKVDGTQTQCASCHGNPPPLPHPQASDCGLCHGDVTPGAPTTFTTPSRHIDGTLDVSTTVACNACHGSATTSAPPKDTAGNTATTTKGVGAHQAHVAIAPTWHKPTTCDQCHLVPAGYTDPGHLDSALPAELVFSGLAASSVWNGASCTSYCHGATLAGGGAKTPIWTKVDGTQAQCSSCHGAPPPPPHPVLTDCGQCHDTMTAGNNTVITSPARHIDGRLDVVGAAACNSCHGSATSDAPPKDTTGNTATTTKGVGAHQRHVATSDQYRAVACSDCHKVPASLNATGHVDTALPAELTFSAIAGTTTTWNGTRCSNNYCHGSTLAGGLTTSPTWTVVDGTQAQCTSCHGNPPPAPHPQSSDCGQCHGDVSPGTPTSFTSPQRHVDGIVDLSATVACNGCHGSLTSNAPPTDTAGNTSTAVRGVGAHQNHLATSNRFKPVACADCHLVPAAATAIGHLDSPLPAELTFSVRAGTTTAWDGAKCSNNYCHGSTLSGGSVTAPVWTQVDGLQSDCTSCHGAPPPAPHPQLAECGQCHDTMTPGGGLTITDASRHVDGNVDVNSATACNTCHGSATSNAPPRDTQGFGQTTARGVGAHQAHLTVANWHKDTTCDQCHRVPADMTAPG